MLFGLKLIKVKYVSYRYVHYTVYLAFFIFCGLLFQFLCYNNSELKFISPQVNYLTQPAIAHDTSWQLPMITNTGIEDDIESRDAQGCIVSSPESHEILSQIFYSGLILQLVFADIYSMASGQTTLEQGGVFGKHMLSMPLAALAVRALTAILRVNEKLFQPAMHCSACYPLLILLTAITGFCLLALSKNLSCIFLRL